VSRSPPAKGARPHGAAEVSAGGLFDTPSSTPTPPPQSQHFHGHRDRLRARFAEAGPAALADYELLELVLFRLQPRRDTKPLAKALLGRFGSIAGVLGAQADQLGSVEGSGPAIASDLKALQALFVRASAETLKARPLLSTWSALVAHLKLDLQHATREQFRVLFLDVKNQLIADEMMAEGTIDHAAVYPREVIHKALSLGAASLILAHNHPSGDPKPSSADVAITRDIVAAAAPLGVKVHDHVIVGRTGAVSLRQAGLM
jgi:DNA repair protein RadC